MDYDTLRQRAETFLQKLYRALYQRHTGQLADIPVKQMYADPGIFTREAILGLKDEMQQAAAADQTQLQLLWAFLIEGYLRLRVAEFDEELAKGYDLLTQSGAWARHDALNAYPQITRPASDDQAQQLLGLYNQRWQTLVAGLHEIDVDMSDYLALMGGVDPLQLAAEASAYLTATEAEYYGDLAQFSKRAGSLQDRSQLELALAAPQFTSSFPEAEQVPAVEDTLYHLGIDVTRQPNLALEINRSLQPGSAMAFPVRVPEEIYLVVSPAGGLSAYEQFLRVTGMIMPKLLLSPKSPWALRRLAHYGIAEAYGELLAGLLGNSNWLVDLLDVDEVIGEFIDFYRFRRLYHQRRAAARLINLVNRSRGQDDYTGVFDRALGVNHTQNSLWMDMGWQRRAIPTWQGLQQGLRLEQSLLNQYGPAWYRNPDATAALRQLWATGEISITL